MRRFNGQTVAVGSVDCQELYSCFVHGSKSSGMCRLANSSILLMFPYTALRLESKVVYGTPEKLFLLHQHLLVEHYFITPTIY